MVQSVASRIKSLGLVLVAILTLASAASVGLGAAAASAQTLGSHGTVIQPQDCSFNGQTSTLGPPPVIAGVPTSAGGSIPVACSNLNTAGDIALIQAQASPLVLVTQCNGVPCTQSGNTAQTFISAFGGDVDLGTANCAFPPPSGSTWNVTYQVPRPFTGGGTACAGAFSAAPNADAACPPTQQQVNVGLVGCAMAVVGANTSSSAQLYGLAWNKYSNPIGVTPQAPTLQLGASSAVAGSSVAVQDAAGCDPKTQTCPYWWGDPLSTAPYAGGTSTGTLPVALPPINMYWQFCPATAPSCSEVSSGSSQNTFEDNATSPSVTVKPAVYNFNTTTSTGNFTSYPTLAGSIPIPSSLAPGKYVLHLLEGNPFGTFVSGNGPALIPGTSSKAIEASANLTVTANTAPEVTGLSPVAGPEAGGTTVTITGKNLTSTTGATTIAFGPNAATNVNCTSSTSCTATAPAGQGAVEVLVTAGTNQPAANPPGDVYTYLAPPGVYTSVVPTRICDTRAGNPSNLSGPAAQCNANGPVGSHKTLPVQVGGLGPSGSTVPSNATAAVLNVTVADTAKPGYLTVWPDGSYQPTTSSLNWAAGRNVPNLVEVALPTNGKVDIFNGSQGSADVMVDLAGYVAPAASGSTAGYFNPLPPARICDTRAGNPSNLSGPAAQCNGDTISGGKVLNIDLGSKVGGLPASGIGTVVVNVTVANPKNAGYLTVFPTGATQPTASNVNFYPNESVPNRVVVKVGKDANSNPSISIFASNNAGTVDVIVDVNGWYTDGSQATAQGQTFTAVSPERLCDTRAGNPSNLPAGGPSQCNGKPVSQGATLPVNIAGLEAVPSMSPSSGSAPTAVVLNVTVVSPTTGGYATVYPEGQTQPTASDLNWSPGDNVANMVVVELGTQGGISIYNSHGTTDYLVDVVGWYS